ncbi:hypothetical protein N657DRAFT_631823 [Parathielavia appendiculata]|uniref:Uncharacterized protein n=1 Tax=Parathielavia appendiculata TaxID=2587402 RepID=A0AAN6U477_9PEZI|nr:hypothetical protein N657DRAFT_631823 [Parathielavia appendiculata]
MLKEASELEHRMTRFRAEELEQALENAVAVARDENVDASKTSKTIGEVFESQQENQALLQAKLDTITNNLLAMKEELHKQSANRVPQFTGGTGDTVEADQDKDSRPQRAAVAELNEVEKRQVDRFIETYSPFVTMVQRIVPCPSSTVWSAGVNAGAVLQTLHEICAVTPRAVANITRFMRTQEPHAWFCARAAAVGSPSSIRTSEILCDRLLCYHDYFQISPRETERVSWYRARFVPRGTSSVAQHGSTALGFGG